MREVRLRRASKELASVVVRGTAAAPTKEEDVPLTADKRLGEVGAELVINRDVHSGILGHLLDGGKI